jgi:hypothetical protein
MTPIEAIRGPPMAVAGSTRSFGMGRVGVLFVTRGFGFPAAVACGRDWATGWATGPALEAGAKATTPPAANARLAAAAAYGRLLIERSVPRTRLRTGWSGAPA